MAIGLSIPVIYCVVVFGGLVLFTTCYKRRTQQKEIEVYFPPHHDRNVYTTLVGMTDPPANDALLKSALLRRAMADVQRVLRLREDKPALQNLLQKGSVGEDIWNSLLAAEKEMEAEIAEVINEANAYVEGWGGIIFQTAGEMIANEKIRGIFEHSHEQRPEKDARYDIKSIRVEENQQQQQSQQQQKTVPAPIATEPTPQTPLSAVPITSAGTESGWTDVDSPVVATSKQANKKAKKRK